MTIFTAIPTWVWLTISTLFFALGEFFSKKFALNPGWSFFFILIAVDIASLSTWLPAIFEENQLSTTGVIWSILSLAMTVLIGILIFGEKLSLIQITGMFLGLIAVVMLSL